MNLRPSFVVLPLLAALWLAPPAVASHQKGWPHVVRAHGRRYIADEHGRELILRGVNVNGLIQYSSRYRETVPIHRSDLREMAALGFNFLRLPINWSRLEPWPGRFSRPYLNRIAHVVRWAETSGLRVVVDFHQDRYNRRLRPGDEADGAPDWATFTDGLPCLSTPLTSPCSVAAYDHFWSSDRRVAGRTLQQHYLSALRTVSRRLRSDHRLLGFELMNEPTFGSTGPPAFEREQLWPFYRRMIAGLRHAGERRMLWFEPSILRDALDRDAGEPRRFSRDPDLVYAPHIYTGTFSSGGIPQLRDSFAAAARESRAYGAAWVDDEWGGGATPARDRFHARELDLQDRYRVGGAFWIWKQPRGFYNWQVVQRDGRLRHDTLRAQQLSRPHVDAIAGRLRATAYRHGRLVARTGGHGGTAVLWSGTVVRRGGPSLLRRPLVRPFVDGRRVRGALHAKRFATRRVSLLGYRVKVRVPAGRHRIELRPGRAR